MPPAPDLLSLLTRVQALFPSAFTPELRPGVELPPEVRARYAGGHVARWFAATDGQRSDEAFAMGYELCSLTDALDSAAIADGLRAEPDGYWVEPEWLAIASDGAGQHLMIDDRTGRVLDVAHDDDGVDEIASSPEAWLQALLDGHARGSIVHDEGFGLVDAALLERVRQAERARERRAAEDATIPTRHKVSLAIITLLALGLLALFVGYLESRR